MSIDNQDIKQLINILQKMLMDNDNSNESVTVEETVKQPKNNIRTRNKKVSKENQSRNKFLDMPEKNMHKEDVAIDKKLNTTGPTPRSRTFSFVDVVCRICGKKDSVNPVLVDNTGRYKCNNCSTSAG